VFVCKGNICRSAFAEAVARRAGLHAVSYGVATRGGDPAEPRAVSFAREYGIDLSPHITQRIDQYVPLAGDLVSAMEPDHLRRLGVAGGAQLTLLGLWGAIPSPSWLHRRGGGSYGREAFLWRRCWAEIQRLARIVGCRPRGA
jgi:protein-tyrosine phosphatase